MCRPAPFGDRDHDPRGQWRTSGVRRVGALAGLDPGGPAQWQRIAAALVVRRLTGTEGALSVPVG